MSASTVVPGTGQLISSSLLRSIDEYSVYINSGEMEWRDILELGKDVSCEKKFKEVFDFFLYCFI